MPDEAPARSYKDSSWDAIEGPLEKKYGLPAGGLRAIRTRGERSNSDQVSDVGASTVYQIMPATASSIKAKHGVDAFSGAAGSAEAAAIVLRDGMRRTGTWKGSVTQYIGGTDPRQHGPITRAYVARVTGEPADPAIGQHESDAGVYRAPIPMTVEQVLSTRPADLKEAGRPLGRVQPNEALKPEASKARMLMAVTGGHGILAPAAPTANQSGIADVLHSEASVIKQEAHLGSYDFFDRQEAAWHNSLLGHIVHAWDEGETPQAEADFHDYYVKHRERIEGLAQDDEEVDWLRTATSRGNLVQIAHRMGAMRQNDTILNSSGGLIGFLQQTATDLVDPVGLAFNIAGGAAIKGLGIGSAALRAAGRNGAALASYAGENAAINIGVTGAMQASGQHTTGSDYVMAGLTGAGIGVLLSPLHFRGIEDRTANEAIDLAEKVTRAERESFKVQARESLGPDATDEANAVEAARLQDDHVTQKLYGLLDEQPDDHRFLSPAPPEGSAEAADPEFGFITKAAPLREGIKAKYRLNDQIADDGERNLNAEQIARAERFDAAYPVGTDGTHSVLEKVGMESTGMRLRNSESPVMRMFAAVTTESTTGAGGRRYTAAMGQAVRERLYLRKIARDDDLFTMFRREQKIGTMRAFFDGEARKRFDERVFLEREMRRGHPIGKSFDASLSVRQAADMYGEAYDLLRVDQQSVGTIGAGRLGTREVSWVYNPHQLASRKVAALTVEQRSNLTKVLTQQIVSQEDFDAKFASKLAKRILARADDKRFGSYDVPFNLRSPEGADIVREALEESGLKGEELTAAIGKFSRGGAQHTKQRLKLDLTADIGGGKRLMDVYNTDMVSLYRGQARRVSGEASLARYGIMGKHGLKQLRVAAQVSGASPADMQAFDQVAAEFMNTPFGEHNHLYLDNVRLATSVSRLGGMGITQLGEYGNGIATVGVHGTLAAIGGFRRLATEVHGLVKGVKSDNPLLHSFDEGGGIIGLDDYRNSQLFSTADNDIPMYGAEPLGLFSRSLRGAAHLQASLSGWRMITAVQTRGFAEQNLRRAIKFTKSGLDDRALNDIGIGPELRAALKKDLHKIAEFDSKGNLKSFDIRAGDMSIHEINQIRSAIERGSSQIIQRTYIGETGKWAHDGQLKILAQFRTFSITSVEKQWGRNVKNYGALRSGMYLLGAISIAAPIHYARVYTHMLGMNDSDRKAYADKHLSNYAVGRAAINYASSAGFLGEVLDTGMGAYSSLTGDDAGVADFTGAGGKSIGGPFVGSTVAPSIGLVNDIYAGLGDLNSANGRKKLYRAVPGANHPLILPLLNLATPPAEQTTGL